MPNTIHRDVAIVTTKVDIPKDAKSYQIRNNSYQHNLLVASNAADLQSLSDCATIKPRTGANWEIEKTPKTHTAYIYMIHDGVAGTIDVEIIFNSYYMVSGVEQGDLNPIRPYRSYVEYTAVNDNENIAYNIATLYIDPATGLGGNRVRDIMIKAETNGCLIGLDNQVAVARGPPVVALAHLNQGETFIQSDHDLFVEITIMNAVALANAEVWIWVAGD